MGGEKAMVDRDDGYSDEGMNDRTAVDRWLGHIELSKRGMKERHDFYKWAKNAYETKYWNGNPGYKMDDPARLEVNVALTIIRALQSSQYSQDPQVICESRFQPPPIREMIGHFAEECLGLVDFQDTSNQLFVDLGLYGMCAVQTGYKAEIAIDTDLVKKQEDKATKENDKLARGGRVSASKDEDHDAHRKIHQMYVQAIAQQYQVRGEELPPMVMAAFEAHLQSHEKVETSNPKTTNEHIRNREVWAQRLEVADDNEPLFGWEYGKSFKTARFVWRQFYRPLSEVKNDEQLDASRVDVKATASINKEMITDIMAEKFGTDFLADTQMVRMFEIWDRGTNKHIIIAEGHPKFLRKKTHPHTGILKDLGVHVCILIDNAKGDSFMSLLEALAPQIKTINRGESIKAVVMNKSVPFKVYNENQLDPSSRKRLKGAQPGSYVGLKVKGLEGPISDIFYDPKSFTITSEMMAAPASSQEWIGILSGISDAMRGGGGGGGESASYTQVSASATGQIMKQWSTRIERFLGEIVSDFVQYGKHFYDQDTLSFTVGPMEGQALFQAFQQMGAMKSRPEKLKVRSGTTMAGIEATLQQNIMALLQSVAQHPLVHQREVLEEVFKSFGFQVDRFLVSEQEEAQRAQLQPGSQEEVVGGPDIAVDAPVEPGAGQPQSGAEIKRNVKSSANKQAANLGAGQ